MARLAVTDDQRRARLVHRQALGGDRAGRTPLDVARALVCLHATEPASPYLSVVARSEATLADIDTAIYDERTLVRQLAMRRTVFTFPRELLAAVWGSASARVSAQQDARLAKDVVQGRLTEDGPAWVREQRAAVLASLKGSPATTAELRSRLPELDRRIVLAEGKSYSAEVAIANRLVTAVAVTGEVLRGVNEGGFRSSRPRWTLAEEWLGEVPEPLPPEVGYRELVRAWLTRFGPGTEADIVWWLGATKSAVRRALGDLEAVEVDLDDGSVGYLLPDDLAEVPVPDPGVALLPVLDPTTMGWKGRGFYLGPHAGRLFDTQGNAGTTAWWDGRIVGGWFQREDARVEVLPLVELPKRVRAALDHEAERLTAWYDGVVVGHVFQSPLTREALRR